MKKNIHFMVWLAAVILSTLYITPLHAEAAKTPATDIADWVIETDSAGNAVLNTVTTADGTTVKGVTIVQYIGKGDNLKVPDFFPVSYNQTTASGGTVTVNEDVPVTVLKANLFYDYGDLKSLIVTSNIVEIEDYAFYHCTNLESINIPSSVRQLGRGVFEKCSSLKQITIPSNIEVIKRHAFYDCTGLEELKFMLPSTTNTIGESAFSGCTSLKKVTLPASITKISDDAFENCSGLTSVTILSGGQQLVQLGKGAFEGCSALKTIEFADNPYNTTNDLKINYIDEHAFWNCPKLAQVYLPTGMYASALQNNCFEGCNSKLVIYGGLSKNLDTYAADRGFSFKYRNGKLKSAALSGTSFKWTGHALKPSISSVTDQTGAVVPSSYYSKSYSANTGIGTATVKITATSGGPYTGSISKTFRIVPRTTALKSLKKGKASFTASWSRYRECTGYQIQYSPYSDFRTSSASTINKNTTARSLTISGLATKKTYYVRIRGYKKVNGKKIYGSWGSKKSVKTK